MSASSKAVKVLDEEHNKRGQFLCTHVLLLAYKKPSSNIFLSHIKLRIGQQQVTAKLMNFCNGPVSLSRYLGTLLLEGKNL